MVGPNIMVGVSEVPDQLGHGAYEIHRGIQHDDWEPVVSGAGEILEGFGQLASAGLLVESGVQAAQTRAAVSAATTGAEVGTEAQVVAKPTTGATPGTAYHRVVKDAPSGSTVSKTTTIVSEEGVVVRQHTDFHGKYEGLRKGVGLEEAGGAPSRACRRDQR